MASQSREGKSAHLQELEEVFERKARRFSPFEILGIKENQQLPEGERNEEDKIPAESEKIRPDPPMVSIDPSMGGPDPRQVWVDPPK